MPKSKAIHKMVDEIFIKDLDSEIIDEIAQERTFVIKMMKTILDDDQMWQMLADDKEMRNVFIWQLQTLFNQELRTSAVIELATMQHGED